jgi:TRAP-type C4-dicarboxylate transport system permease small subunit
MRTVRVLLSRLNGLICFVCSTVVTLALSAISAILFAAVTSRYFLNNPITWAEDATCFLMVWMVLAGSVVAMRKRDHVAIDLLVEKLPPIINQILKIAVTLTILYVCWFMVWHGVSFTKMGMQRIIPSMDWLKFGYAYLALPVGFFLLALICLELLVDDLIGLRSQVVKEAK